MKSYVIQLNQTTSPLLFWIHFPCDQVCSKSALQNRNYDIWFVYIFFFFCSRQKSLQLSLNVENGQINSLKQRLRGPSTMQWTGNAECVIWNNEIIHLTHFSTLCKDEIKLPKFFSDGRSLDMYLLSKVSGNYDQFAWDKQFINFIDGEIWCTVLFPDTYTM